MIQERKSVVTLKGMPLTLLGEEIKIGQKAPDFKVLTNDLKEVSLADFKERIKLFSVVPSLDTPVCDLQTKRFNQEAVVLSDDIIILTISMDLPFAQKRFCDANKIDKIKVLSDHKDASFGLAYGVLIKELRLLSRAIFIADKADTIQYVEYVKELSAHPNYETAKQELSRLSIH